MIWNIFKDSAKLKTLSEIFPPLQSDDEVYLEITLTESNKITVNSEKSNVILGRISRDGDESSILEIEDITETNEVANAGDRCTDQDTPDQESSNPIIEENSQTESGCIPEVLDHSENFDQNQGHLIRSRNDTRYDAVDMETEVDVNRQITPEVVITPEPEVDVNRQITPELVITPEPEIVKSAAPEAGLAEPGLHRVHLTPQILPSKEVEPVPSNKPADSQHFHRPWEDQDYVNVSVSKQLVDESLQENDKSTNIDPLDIFNKVVEANKQKSKEIRGPSTSSPLSNMKGEPISPCLGLKFGSEDDIEVIEIFEKEKDPITETAMNTTYEVIRPETEIVDGIDDNQDEDQEVQIIEVVQDKIIPKLTKEQMAMNKVRETLDARGLRSIEIVTPTNTIDEIVQDEKNDTIEEDTVNDEHVENQGLGDNFNVKSALMNEFKEKLAAHGLKLNSNNIDELILDEKQDAVEDTIAIQSSVNIVLKIDSMPSCKICGLVYSNQRMGKPEIRRHLLTEHCLQNDILKKVNTFL